MKHQHLFSYIHQLSMIVFSFSELTMEKEMKSQVKIGWNFLKGGGGNRLK